MRGGGPDWVAHEARRCGPLKRGWRRVIVVESDASISHSDFSALADAQSYADDAASESDDSPPLAYILDSDFRVIGRGRHYADRGGPTCE